MQPNRTWLLVALLPALLTGCSDKPKANDNPENVSTIGGALKQLASQAKELTKNGPVKTVDFRQLKALLPDTASGLPRKEATGEKDEMAGFSVSTAEGKYSNSDGSKTIEMELIDAGGSVATMGIAAWSMADIDKETATGYEKTTTTGYDKTLEKYDSVSEEAEITVLANKRYVIMVRGKGIGMDELKAVVQSIDRSKLPTAKAN